MSKDDNKTEAADTVKSYTEMAPPDLDSIGSHCAFCRQIDFLPFRCESCGDNFCLDHRMESSHLCPKKGAWAAARAERAREQNISLGDERSNARPNIYTHDKQCADTRCKELLDSIGVVAVDCSSCNRQYCWKHRMPEDHDCKNLIPIGARPTASILSSQRASGIAAFAKLKAWGAEKKSEISKSGRLAMSTAINDSSTTMRARARRQKINELKQSAKGNRKFAEESRIYVWLIGVTDSSAQNWPKARAFYPRDFNVGRVLDLAAKDLKMTNNNNRVTEEGQRLRIFHIKGKAAGGKLLSFDTDKPLGSQDVVTGDALVVFKGTIPPISEIELLLEF